MNKFESHPLVAAKTRTFDKLFIELYIGSMSERLPNALETPWGMPEEIFKDYARGSEIRRAQWALDAQRSMSLKEVMRVMRFRDPTLLHILAQKLESGSPKDDKEQRVIQDLKDMFTRQWSSNEEASDATFDTGSTTDKQLAGDEFESRLISLLYTIERYGEFKKFDIASVDQDNYDQTSPVVVASINELCEALGIKASQWTRSLSEDSRSSFSREYLVELEVSGLSFGEFFVNRSWWALPIEARGGDSACEIALNTPSGKVIRFASFGSYEAGDSEEEDYFNIDYSASIKDPVETDALLDISNGYAKITITN